MKSRAIATVSSIELIDRETKETVLTCNSPISLASGSSEAILDIKIGDKVRLNSKTFAELKNFPVNQSEGVAVDVLRWHLNREHSSYLKEYGVVVMHPNGEKWCWMSYELEKIEGTNEDEK